MNVSEKCLALIREFEGFRSKPYLCPAGVPTIGYGSTRYEDGTPVTLKDEPIDQARANAIMRTTLAREYEPAVQRYVKVPLTQGQYDALVDFAYNAGAKNLLQSTLLKKVNAKNHAGASKEFEKWVYGGGKVLQGLVRRRKAEQALFLS